MEVFHTGVVEISWLPHMWIPAHYAYNAEMNLKSTATNGFHFFFYNEFVNGVSLTCLTVTLISNEHPHLFHIGDPTPLYPQHSIPLVKGLYSLSLYKTPIPRPIDQIIHTNKKLKRLYSVIIYTNCHHKACPKLSTVDMQWEIIKLPFAITRESHPDSMYKYAIKSPK